MYRFIHTCKSEIAALVYLAGSELFYFTIIVAVLCKWRCYITNIKSQDVTNVTLSIIYRAKHATAHSYTSCQMCELTVKL